MRRQDLQLLNRARAGELASRCEVGRRYLRGVEGFPHNIELAMSYLYRSLQQDDLQAHRIVAECMSLRDILAHELLPSLERAALTGNPVAQFKLGVWRCFVFDRNTSAERLLEAASLSGSESAARCLDALRDPKENSAAGVLRAATREHPVDSVEIARQAVLHLLEGADVDALFRAMHCMVDLAPVLTPAMADVVLVIVQRAKAFSFWPAGTQPLIFEASLEDCAARGNRDAAYILGLALCGFDQGNVGAATITTGRNLRKGAALLLRAADAGVSEAWDVLYRVHADNRSSVANPQMARFFLEKAAAVGDAQAQRRLGALILRSGNGLHASEIALAWLYQATQHGDTAARGILRSLVLPVHGDDEVADTAIDAMMREAPAIANRLRVARDFGLTRLEALCVDLMAGVRPWGLVVGENRYLAQVRLAQPRAIPALHDKAQQRLRRAAAFFEQLRQDGGPAEGDLRMRSARLRRLLASYGVEEDMFFARATSSKLDTLRHGAKLAFGSRPLFQSAIAAPELVGG